MGLICVSEDHLVDDIVSLSCASCGRKMKVDPILVYLFDVILLKGSAEQKLTIIAVPVSLCKTALIQVGEDYYGLFVIFTVTSKSSI